MAEWSKILNEKCYESVDNLVEDINTVLCDASEQSSKKIIRKPLALPKQIPKWYNESLFCLKKNLDIKHKLFEKYRRDPIVRGNFSVLLNTIEKCLRKEYGNTEMRLLISLILC